MTSTNLFLLSFRIIQPVTLSSMIPNIKQNTNCQYIFWP